MGDLLGYMIPNILLFLIALIMKKNWGIKLGPTVLSEFLIYICAVLLTDDFNEPLYIKIIFNTIVLLPVSFFILVALKNQNNLIIIKDIKIWLIVFISGIVSTVLICIFHYIEPIYLVISLCIAPVYESLLFQEILFTTLKSKFSSKNLVFIMCIVSLIVAFSHRTFTLASILWRTIGFFILFLIRWKFPANSKFWIIVLIHTLVNTTIAITVFLGELV